MRVTLSWPELRTAAHIGIDQYVRALSRNHQPAHGAHWNDWHKHVIGAWGECVIAKATGTYWVDTNGPDGGAADVGPYHVRTTHHPNGCLPLHETDIDDEPFVLVILERLPSFRIAGWCIAEDGKQPQHWRTDVPNPAYFVPQVRTAPMAGMTTPDNDRSLVLLQMQRPATM